MKRKPTANPSSLFLLELIFAILFFSVASAVCVQVFVKSHTLSTQAHDLTQASRRAGDVAELITASTSPDDMKNLLEDAYSDAVNIASENFTIFYDSDFIPCSQETAVWQLSGTWNLNGQLLDVQLDVTKLTSGVEADVFISCLSDIICKGGTDHETEEKISFSFIHMGAPSLLMIFLVLCLFTFALLSLSSAKNNRTLSQQSADRIQAYYQASSLAEQALDQIDTILSDTYKNCGAESADASVYQKELTEQLKNCSMDGVSDLTIDFTKKKGL